AGGANQQLAVGRDKVYAALAGGSGRAIVHAHEGPNHGGYVGNAGQGYAESYVSAAGRSDARHAYAGANGGIAEGQGRRVRPLIFDRDDSASQWRVDNGEGFVRYGGRGAGRRRV